MRQSASISVIVRRLEYRRDGYTQATGGLYAEHRDKIGLET